jgi:hypothetical protein
MMELKVSDFIKQEHKEILSEFKSLSKEEQEVFINSIKRSIKYGIEIGKQEIGFGDNP